MDLSFEVLKTGDFTDTSGKQVSFTEDTLQQIADSYDPNKHEAPLVIGHPETVPQNGEPAYGWIQTLSRTGDRLIAHAKQVIPEMLEMIKTGLYKKVSVGLNKDNTLHHVGLLGAEPPAVQGLKPITFSESGQDLTTIETESPIPDLQLSPSLPDSAKQAGFGKEGGSRSETGESEIVATESTEKAEELQSLKSQIKSLQEEIHVLTTNQKAPDTSVLAQEAHSFSAFIDDALNKGRLTPAQAELFKGLTESFKNPDIRTFAESPGSFFTVARKLVTSNESRLLRPANYNPSNKQGVSAFETARSAIANKMHS
ncbi:MAG: hypothetical protein HY965_03645 [Ignavibacteriales bacterium]|nr:hypothetical protein [Ignavibacteriales bacterium]